MPPLPTNSYPYWLINVCAARWLEFAGHDANMLILQRLRPITDRNTMDLAHTVGQGVLGRLERDAYDAPYSPHYEAINDLIQESSERAKWQPSLYEVHQPLIETAFMISMIAGIIGGIELANTLPNINQVRPLVVDVTNDLRASNTFRTPP